MNTQTQEALKMAIDTLESCSMFTATNDYSDYLYESIGDALKACKEALAQPAQEPVAWYWNNNHRDKIPYAGVERGNPKMDVIYGTPIPLYTHPAPSWQGLSDDGIREIGYDVLEKQVWGEDINWIDFARAIEQALKEKNT